MVYKKNKTRRGLNKKRKQHTRKNLKISKITSQIKKSLKNIQFGGDDHKHGQVGGDGGNVILTKVNHQAEHNGKKGIELTFFVNNGIVASGGPNQSSQGGEEENGPRHSSSSSSSSSSFGSSSSSGMTAR